MNNESIRNDIISLINSGQLKLNTDIENGYYGETTVIITLSLGNEVIMSDSATIYSDYDGLCICNH